MYDLCVTFEMAACVHRGMYPREFVEVNAGPVVMFIYAPNGLYICVTCVTLRTL